MKRYVKMRKYGSGAWLNANQQNQQSQLAPVYGAVGNTANTMLQPNVGEDGFVDWNNQKNVNRSITGSTLQYAGQGAALGANPALLAATGGLSAPIGAVAGATVGFIKGKSDANKNKNLYNRYLQTQQDNQKAAGIMNYQSNLQQGFEPFGNLAQSKTGFKKGGFINPKKNSQQTGGSQTSFKKGGRMSRYAQGTENPNGEYEVEKGEYIEGNDVNLAEGQQIASDMHKVGGNTHENGGTVGQGGERVYSDRSYVSPLAIEAIKQFGYKIPEGSSHAAAVEILAKKQGKYEENSHAVNHRERNSAMIMIARVKELQDLIFQDQEMQKGENLQQFKYGGYLPKKAKGGRLKRYAYAGEINPTRLKFKPDESGYSVQGAYDANNPIIGENTPKHSMWNMGNPEGDKILEEKTNRESSLPYRYNIYNQKIAPSTPITNTPQSLVLTPQPKVSTNSNLIEPNLDNNLGTVLNTVNLANNLAGINKLQTYYQPKYPVAPVYNYNKSDTQLGIYNNKAIANTALRGMNRYNPNMSNRYATTAAALDANNNLTANENQRRTGFNNMVAGANNAVQNERLNIDNQVQKEKLLNENNKIALRNQAVQAYAQGELEQNAFTRQLKLDKYKSELNRIGNRYHSEDYLDIPNMSSEQIESELSNKNLPNETKTRYKAELDKRKANPKKAFGRRLKRYGTISVFD